MLLFAGHIGEIAQENIDTNPQFGHQCWCLVKHYCMLFAHLSRKREEMMRPFKTSKHKPPKKTSHHYVLAHVALRQIAQNNPYEFFGVMCSTHRYEFLDDLFKQICETCDKEGSAFFDSRDILVHPTVIGEYPTLLIEMPPAYYTPEAHLVCIVLRVPLSLMPSMPENPTVLYFTLEKGSIFLTGKNRTVLCAWRGESHLNYGDGPKATPGAFMETIKEMIE